MLKRMAMVALAAVSLTIAAGTVRAQALHPSTGDMPSGSMGPATVPEMSLPFSCDALSDEIARLDKFAKSPTATPKQIAANKTRSDKMKEKLENMRADDKCPPAATPAAAPAAK